MNFGWGVFCSMDICFELGVVGWVCDANERRKVGLRGFRVRNGAFCGEGAQIFAGRVRENLAEGDVFEGDFPRSIGGLLGEDGDAAFGEVKVEGEFPVGMVGDNTQAASWEREGSVADRGLERFGFDFERAG